MKDGESHIIFRSKLEVLPKNFSKASDGIAIVMGSKDLKVSVSTHT